MEGQIINQTLNINVNNATPAVPNTGFVTSATNMVDHLGVIGCSVLFAIILGFTVIAVMLLLQYKRHQQKSSLFLGTGLLAVSFGLFVPSLAMTSTGISGDTPETLETNIDIVTTPEGQVATGDTTITLANDMPDGFAIYAYMENDNALYNADGSAKIEATALTSSADPSSLTLNSYGIQNSSKQQYMPIPVASLPEQYQQLRTVYATGANTVAGTKVNLTFAAKLDDSVPTGTYTGHIIFAIEPIIPIQDVTSDVCQSFEMNKQIYTWDQRDGRFYTIAHLQDDRCWMTKNLALGAMDQNITLTPEDSNVNENFVLPASNRQWEADSLNVPQILIHIPKVSGEPEETYYNWNAATAGTGNARYDYDTSVNSSICPKNWQLPQYDEINPPITTNEDVTNDYYNMLKWYLPEEGWNGHSWYDENLAVKNDPIYFNLPGVVYLYHNDKNEESDLWDTVVEGRQNLGFWWFNTAAGYSRYSDGAADYSPRAYALRIERVVFNEQEIPVDVDPSNYLARTRGASIRCVTQLPR